MSTTELLAWKDVPTSVASDCMNRTQAMNAEIKSVRIGARICGQARTVTPMVGDGGVVHSALEETRPGQILMVAAGGAKEVAVWGGVGHAAAARHGVGGIVIDGAIRDAAEIRASSLPCFCSAVTPRGPHLEFGGTYGGVTAVGGVSVAPGDLVLADDDGVVVVPLAWATRVLGLALAHMEKEKKWMVQIDAGKTISQMFDFPAVETLRFGSEE